MPKYQVILTRDITESTVVIVEAENVSDAEEKAIDISGRYGAKIPSEKWEIDGCGYCGDVYPTGVDIVEEDE